MIAKLRFPIGMMALGLVALGTIAAPARADIEPLPTGRPSQIEGAMPGGARLQPFQPFSFMHETNVQGHRTYSAGEQVALWVTLGVAIAGLLYAGFLMVQVHGVDKGTTRMQKVGAAIRAGARAYLGRQFKTLVILILILFGILYFTAQESVKSIEKRLPTEGYVATPENVKLEQQRVFAIALGRASAFLLGAIFSGMVGYMGMTLAVQGNMRVASAARTSYGTALQVGYRTGTITGMLTDGLGLLGGTLIFMIYGEQAYAVLLGFGFGGTLLALFMRVGGGIYTKAADVGADLVGKIEAGIPEDDPRNAATIADNVGDNVGDCAGMAADIFESYEVTIVAAMILGYASFGHKGVIFPLLVRAIGVFGSIISTYTVKAGPESTSDEALHSVHRGFTIGSILSVVGFILLGLFYLRFDAAYLMHYPQTRGGFEHGLAGLPWIASLGLHSVLPGLDMRPAWTCLVGIILAVALNKCTSYYTHTQYAPVRSLTKACQTGHATNIIQGFAVGYESTVAAALIIAVAILLSALIYAGSSPIFVAYGVAMCGIGMLTLTGNTISMDVFGPVADNANGIGEMAYNHADPKEEGYLPPEQYKRARQILADLDAVGNTTKAETKGIAIGSAVIAAVSLFASFIAVIAGGSEEAVGRITQLQYNTQAAKLSVAIPEVFIGMLIGGAIPFLFSSMTIRAVGRAAFLIVKECRAQFRDQEIWAGTKTPNYGRVVNICTATAQRELIGPGLLAILAPLVTGYLLGAYALGGFLAGLIVSGQLLAVFMANAGGAWDNAKKLIEDGLYGGKGSEAHKAGVTGDTVGDPLKDTAGPALNPLIKVMNMVSLLALPLIIWGNVRAQYPWALVGWAVIVVGGALIAWAIYASKVETAEMKAMEQELAGVATGPMELSGDGSAGREAVSQTVGQQDQR